MKKVSNIEYLLENTINTESSIISDAKTGGLKFKSVFQDADTINGNGIIYSTKSLNDVIRLAQPKIQKNAFVGERNHPFDSSPKRFTSIDLGNLSHRILSFNWNGKLLEGVGQTLSTSVGKDMRALLEEDLMTLSFSLRALGSKERNGSRAPIVDSVTRLIAYDWVHNPSHECANTINLLEESDVLNMMKHESGNLDFLQESLELDHNIRLCESNEINFDPRTNMFKIKGDLWSVQVKLEESIKESFRSSFKRLLV